MKIVDTRGQSCPAPLIATKRALRERLNNDPFEVITDNLNTLNNISRFLNDNKTRFKVEESGASWTLTVFEEGKAYETPDVLEYCAQEIPHFTRGNFVIAFSSDTMGNGDERLGTLLMTNFIKAVKDFEVLPDKMVFYNRGVILGSVDSPVAEDIRLIEKMGVRVYFCSTCVDYYSLQDKVKIGTLSNMFEIAQAMASAGNVIRP